MLNIVIKKDITNWNDIGALFDRRGVGDEGEGSALDGGHGHGGGGVHWEGRRGTGDPLGTSISHYDKKHRKEGSHVVKERVQMMQRDELDNTDLSGLQNGTEEVEQGYLKKNLEYRLGDKLLSDDAMNTFAIKFSECLAHLQSSDGAIGHLKGAIGKDYADLGLVLDEPEIWRSPFPTDAYRPLIGCFSDVTKASRSVSSAVRSFCAILQDMVAQGEGGQVVLHLHTLSFMTRHLLAIFNLTDIALRLASSADSSRTDLTALVTLSRRCEALLSDVDHHYRHVYSTLNLDFLTKLDPTLLIAFQDVFHSVHSAVEHLSHLGITLRTVRDVEVLTAL